eukprot:363519-Chlamydomonas_euryale.AAC.6
MLSPAPVTAARPLNSVCHARKAAHAAAARCSFQRLAHGIRAPSRLSHMAASTQRRAYAMRKRAHGCGRARMPGTRTAMPPAT